MIRKSEFAPDDHSVSGIVEDAYETGFFESPSDSEIDDEIHRMLAARTGHSVAYVHWI